MRIAIFGATGMVGRAVVAEAHARGHRIVALSRNPDRAIATDRISVRAVDVGDSDALDPVLAEVDAAVLAVRPRPGDETRLAPMTRNLLDGAERQDTRVLIVGGSAPLRSPDLPGRLVIDDPHRVPAAWRAIARASLEQFDTARMHSHRRWTYLSPPAVLAPGARSGRYRRGTGTLLTDEDGASWISAPDLAIAVVDELENAGIDQHFTVAHHGRHGHRVVGGEDDVAALPNGRDLGMAQTAKERDSEPHRHPLGPTMPFTRPGPTR
ncbi:MAG: NAD(P)H-binding protein [Solirubrobacterales bacterium]